MTPFGPPVIHRLGTEAILLHWDEPIREDLLYYMLRIKRCILNSGDDPRPEVLNTYNTLLLNYPYKIRAFEAKKQALLMLIKDLPGAEELQQRLFTLPVCYHESLGIDLAEVSVLKNISKEEIVARHSQSTYTVYFQGFLPGFLYLGGLDPELAVSRKREPRLYVKKGAVGLAEHQTGIYPQDSAGGWQIIGGCPVSLFNPEKNPPSPFAAGDKIKFEPVSLSDYREIEADDRAGEYQLPSVSLKL